MNRKLAFALITCGVAGSAVGTAWTQTAMLEPPTNHYFVSEGTWGQKRPDQWALPHIGFDGSPDSAWRLVKRDAKPVIVAVIDTGLDWNHRNIAPENIWTNPGRTCACVGNGIDDDKNGFVDDVMGWDFVDHDNRPWDYDGHGTFVAGLIAGSWGDKDGMAGINPLARLMILKAVNNFGHTWSSYIAEAIGYAADNGARVVNLSVGGREITAVEQAAIDYAYSKGVVIVVAAGNEGGVDTSKFGIAASLDKRAHRRCDRPASRIRRRRCSPTGAASRSRRRGSTSRSFRARRTDVLFGIGCLGNTRLGTAYLCRRRTSATTTPRRHVVLGTDGRGPRLADDRQRSKPDQYSGHADHQEHGARCRFAGRRSIYRLWRDRRQGAEGAEELLSARQRTASRREWSRRARRRRCAYSGRPRRTSSSRPASRSAPVKRRPNGSRPGRSRAAAWRPTERWAISRQRRLPERRSGR